MMAPSGKDTYKNLAHSSESLNLRRCLRLQGKHTSWLSVKALRKLPKVDALVIDELCYLPMIRQARNVLFQLINRFYEHWSLIITTNGRPWCCCKDFTS